MSSTPIESTTTPPPIKIDEFGFINVNRGNEADNNDKGIIENDAKVVKKIEMEWVEMIEKSKQEKKDNLLNGIAREELGIKLKKGIPPSIRGLVWKSLLLAPPALHGDDNNNNRVKEKTYQELLNQESDKLVETMIDKDIPRTLPNNVMFNAPNSFGSISLKNILMAFSKYRPDIGYCSGMSYIVATLLLYIPDEEDTFWSFVALCNQFNLESQWLPSTMSKHLEKRSRLTKSLLQSLIPTLYNHFESNQIEVSMLSQNYYQTLMTYSLPYELVVRIWDLYLLDGDVVLHASYLALLKVLEKQLLQCDFEQSYNILCRLKEFIGGPSFTFNIEKYIDTVVKFRDSIIDKLLL